MRNIVVISMASFFLGLGVATQSALAAGGGMGGPSDAWGSPYVLIAPQAFQAATWGSLEGRSAYESQVAPLDCHGDRSCEQRLKRRAHPTPPQ